MMSNFSIVFGPRSAQAVNSPTLTSRLKSKKNSPVPAQTNEPVGASSSWPSLCYIYNAVVTCEIKLF